MKTLLFYGFGMLLVTSLIMSFSILPQQNPWVVPDKYKTMKNPVTFDKTAAAALWSTHCKSCHGKEGLGDGTKAAQLDTEPGDFSTEAFQKQTDGAIFYKTLEGRDDMPAFNKKLPDQNDIWQLVHYMRTLAE